MQGACRENPLRFQAQAGSMNSFGAVDAQKERRKAQKWDFNACGRFSG
jgi:hypothetical protein